jgi:P-type Mg2+ transporter
MAQWAGQGWRVLGLASREMGAREDITKDDEAEMTFLGFLLFEDPVKADVVETIGRLKSLGVALKIVTGDNRLVAAHVGQAIGLSNGNLLTGEDLRQMSDEALVSRVTDVHVFAEVEPNQKERIILALKKAGHVVGYGGDGINDASALHAADVGVSVESAVDVAKEAADIMLLEKDLGILVEGVQEGRRTFANTLKYVFMATSANFGNMFSMAGASLFLSFLPLLPKQILLTNLLTDIPEMTIAGDRVDEELIDRPRRWNIAFIRKFMLTFGLVSSIFDYITFGVLLLVFQAGVEEFRTGWFVESVISASVIVLVVRTRRPFTQSRPSRGLLVATLSVVGLTLLLPYTMLSVPLGFVPLPPLFLAALLCIVVGYVVAAEVAKKVFYRHVVF